MEIMLQIIGYSFIPLLAILAIGGVHDIVAGLKEHFSAQPIKLKIIPGDIRVSSLLTNANFKGINRDFCEN